MCLVAVKWIGAVGCSLQEPHRVPSFTARCCMLARHDPAPADRESSAVVLDVGRTDTVWLVAEPRRGKNGPMKSRARRRRNRTRKECGWPFGGCPRATGPYHASTPPSHVHRGALRYPRRVGEVAVRRQRGLEECAGQPTLRRG